ncbi:hypothetical protein [Halioxenophilus aromaticivorans]|uniref:Histidine kinase n=1 Tax=Halioxenophilus aromaticivorans TaxID=1306992 RepID=A0AAV3U2X5_9ALTE
MPELTQQQSQSEFRHTVRNHLNNISVHAELAKLLASKNAEGAAQLTACIDKILSECKLCAQSISKTDSN